MLRDILNVGIGLATSFVSWYALYHLLAPKVEISPFISKVPNTTTNDTYRYRVKFRNASRRTAHELAYQVMFKFRDLNVVSTRNMRYIRFSLSADGSLRLRNNRILVIYANQLRHQDDALLASMNITTRDVGNLLACLPEASLEFSCMATDGFSGSRRYFERTFTHKDVREGPFQAKSPYSPLRDWYSSVILRRPHPILEMGSREEELKP
jgi:hypothetical protein